MGVACHVTCLYAHCILPTDSPLLYNIISYFMKGPPRASAVRGRQNVASGRGDGKEERKEVSSSTSSSSDEETHPSLVVVEGRKQDH